MMRIAELLTLDTAEHGDHRFLPQGYLAGDVIQSIPAAEPRIVHRSDVERVLCKEQKNQACLVLVQLGDGLEVCLRLSNLRCR